MAATGELKSIKDRQGNTLTFEPNGIISSAGKTVTFERDGQGRITKVTSPAPSPGIAPMEWDYAYDGSGDLVSVDLPPTNNSATVHYTYDQHRLATTVDARNHAARTSTYYPDGRLETDTDAMSNVTSYTYDLGDENDAHHESGHRRAGTGLRRQGQPAHRDRPARLHHHAHVQP